MDPLSYTNGMTDSQKLLFMSEFNQRRKDPTVGVLLALFLGGVGAHRFYLGQVGLGILYLILLPFAMIIGVLEAFVMGARVRRFNERVARKVADIVTSNGSEREPRRT